MRLRPLRVALLLVFVLARATLAQTPVTAAAPVAASAEKISVSGIHNAGRVTPFLYRGAQPALLHLSELKKLGITTIVDLRKESAHTSELERSAAESLGMRFVHLPLGGFSTPSSEQLARYLSLFRAAPPQTIFVHCEFGEDRTGMFIASYRIAFQHWSPEQALAEMLTFGFHPIWHPAMVTYVRDLPARLQTDATLKSVLGN